MPSFRPIVWLGERQLESFFSLEGRTVFRRAAWAKRNGCSGEHSLFDGKSLVDELSGRGFYGGIVHDNNGFRFG